MLKRMVLLTPVLLVALLTSGCTSGVPTKIEAPYQIYSEQYGSVGCIYASSYKIVDGVLYLDNYWSWDSGMAIIDMHYFYHDTPLLFTGWMVGVR